MRHNSRRLSYLLLLLALIVVLISPAGAVTAQTKVGGAVAPPIVPSSRVPGTYSNPLEVQIPGDGLVQSCADPSIIRGQTSGDSYWYMYCTTDPINDQERDPNGGLVFHMVPMLRSYDLTHWTYMGDAFSSRPSWMAPQGAMWAPEIKYFNNQYYLYFTANDTSLPGGGSAIGVATSSSPLGPW